MGRTLEPYIRPYKPLRDDNFRRHIDRDIASARAMRAANFEPPIRVGDEVWCVFSDTPEGKVEDGTVVDMIINGWKAKWACSVVQDYSAHCQGFDDKDYDNGLIWLKEDR